MPRRSRSRAGGLTFGKVLSHLGVMVAVAAALGILVGGLAVPWIGVLGYGAHAVDESMRNLPEELRAEPLAQRSRVLDRKGNVIATFYDENRVNVPLRKVAPVMRRAIVAIEDYRFYEHGALDLKGTLRAFVNNQTGGGTQGGSSITQQMAKLTAVAQAGTEAERKAATANTYQRKIQELRHAIAFEQNYSKRWILERYLNLAYFGDGAYGIEAAARHYFSVHARELNLKQAAMLAGLVKNPVGFAPTRFPDRAKARRDIVLARMAQLDIIPSAKADRLEGKRLGLKLHRSSNGCVSSKAPFFCDYVRRYLLADGALGRTRDDRAQLLRSGGLTIKTTLDLRFQRAADAATHAAVQPTDQAIGALAMVEPGTGQVRAVSQSRPMGRNGKKGETYLNYVVNSKYGDSGGFQAGSTFKVFVLAAALEQGLPTSTAFDSPAQVHIPQNEFETCNGPYPVYSTWDPRNSTSNGRFDMYKGTQLSVNTYFAQLERKTGLCEPYALAKAMGVELTDPAHERLPSFTLGVASISPLEMSGAYATFAARGKHCDTRPVTTILNSDGKVFKKYPAQCQQVIQQSTADTVNDILRGVMAPGGFGQALVLEQPSAGKTGTIQNNAAVWFDGYTPNMAAAAMVAGANSKGQPISLNGQSVGGRYIDVAHGSTVAGPMWAQAMRGVQAYLPNVDFAPRSAPTGTPISVSVPDVKGMRMAAASRKLAGLGFHWDEGEPRDSSARRGRAAETSPAAGASLPRGSSVTIHPAR